MLTDGTFLTMGACTIHPTARVCAGAVVGKRFRPLLAGGVDEPAKPAPTTIRANSYIGYQVLIGCGSDVAEGAIVDDRATVECDVRIGRNTLLIYGAHVCNEARLGDDCVVGGFVAERARLGNGVRMFGKIIHSQRDPTKGWDAPQAMEESAVLEDGVFVGFDALVIGKVVIGEGAYVCAGAIVTRDVPARHIAFCRNRIRSREQWRGSLGRSQFFDRATKPPEGPCRC